MPEVTSQARSLQENLQEKLRHIGVSLLPMALFVGGALGYEQIAAAWPDVSVRSVRPRASAPDPATAQVRSARAPADEITTPAAPAAIAVPAPAVRPVPAIASLRDDRNLLELSHTESPRSDGGAAIGKPSAGTSLEQPAPSARLIDLTIGSGAALPLGFTAGTQVVPGTYGILRGVPQNARLTHGIGIGEASWLIDGAEIAAARIDMRAGIPGDVSLELTVIGADGRVISRQKVTLVVRMTAPVDATWSGALKMEVARETELIPGRGSLLWIDIEPRAAVPTNSYIVLRGLPEGTVLSRGMAMGPQAWLLSLADLSELEVRLPARASGAVALDARLIAADGKLLADTKVELSIMGSPARESLVVAAREPQQPTGSVETKPVAPVAPVAPVVQVAPVAPVAPAAPVALVAPPQQPAREAGPASRSAAVTPGVQRTGRPATTLPLSAAAQQNVSLSHGRRMLELGNISSARPLLERAASEGSGEAAALLAASFDPAWLQRTGVIGIASRPEQALLWYAEARRLGTNDPERVAILPTPPPKPR